MISKEKLKQDTELAISNSQIKIEEDFNNSIVLINKILDSLFSEVKKKKYEESIERMLSAQANDGQCWATFALFNTSSGSDGPDYRIYTGDHGDIFRLPFLKKKYKQSVDLEIIRSLNRYFQRRDGRIFNFDKLEIKITDGNYHCSKKYSYHKMDFVIRLNINNGLFLCNIFWG